MPITYTPIATYTAPSAQSSVTFSSIASTYTDLILVMWFSLSTANDSVFMRFNGDTATNYSDTTVSGNGTVTVSGRDNSSSNGIRLTAWNTAQSAGTRQMNTVHIMNYANTTTSKKVLSRYSSAGGTEAFVGLWRKTPEAVNSIVLRFSGSANFETGSTFTLYGIQAA